MEISEEFNLASGNKFEIIKIQKDLIPNYYLLAFPKTQGEPSVNEVSEMLRLGIRHGKVHF